MTGPASVGVVEVTTAPVATPLSIQGGVTGIVVDPAVLCYGWSIRNTSAANPAQVDLYDGSDATGQLLVSISLLASESTRDLLGAPGIFCPRGIFANVVAGTVVGVVYAGLLS